MPQAVKAKCPGCQTLLRIPADWLQGSLRCKHCGLILQARPKGASGSRNGTPAVKVSTNGTAHAAPANPFDLTAPAGADHFDFDQQPDTGFSSAAARYRRKARLRSLKSALTLLAILGLAGGITWWNWDTIVSRFKQAGVTRLEGPSSSTEKSTPPVVPEAVKPAGTAKTPEAAAPVFPRRLLAVSVNNYLYANPVSTGAYDEALGFGIDPKNPPPDRTFHATLQRLAEFMHVAPEQVVELSDGAPKNVAQPPLKPVIESTIHTFLAGSRKQDRVILFFIGHAVEIKDECFLVPIEGELGVKETLIPLTWLYEELSKCPAQQKVLIMDVCRFNPSRGLERPAGGPMGAKLDAMLKNPPPGVQVWSSCTAGQYSYEGFVKVGDGMFSTNSMFIAALANSLGVQRVNPGIQTPESPLPVEVLANGTDKAKGVNRGTQDEASEAYLQPQTPRLTGEAPAAAVPYDPHEPMPAKVAIQLPPAPDGDAASREMVQKILDQIDAQMAKEGEQPLRVEALPVFSAKRLAEYNDDGAMTPFREEILKTAQLLKKHAKTFKEDFRGQANGNDAALKALILERQKEPARAFNELQEQLEALQQAGEQRAEEKSKRWRANYDYVLARLEARLAYVYEYNYMLGMIRKDALPKRDPTKFTGFRLASQEKLQSGSEARKLAADSKKLLGKIVQQHQGTPWEVLAKRQALNALGLEWQPIP